MTGAYPLHHKTLRALEESWGRGRLKPLHADALYCAWMLRGRSFLQENVERLEDAPTVLGLHDHLRSHGLIRFQEREGRTPYLQAINRLHDRLSARAFRSLRLRVRQHVEFLQHRGMESSIPARMRNDYWLERQGISHVEEEQLANETNELLALYLIPRITRPWVRLKLLRPTTFGNRPKTMTGLKEGSEHSIFTHYVIPNRWEPTVRAFLRNRGYPVNVVAEVKK